MIIKFINTNIRFRNIREEDFTAIGFDGQEGIRMDTHVMPYVDLPDPVAQWLLDNEPRDWERADEASMKSALILPPSAAPAPQPLDAVATTPHVSVPEDKEE